MAALSDLVLLYDGLCGFCNGTVRFILARDPGGRMRFAPLGGETAKAVFKRHPDAARIDSLVLVERGPGSGERVFVRSEAALQIARYLGGVWRLAAAFRLIPRPLRDWSYDLFARFRYRLFGRYTACPVPEASVSERFLK